MACSMPVTAPAWTQRLVKFSAAWAAPSPIAASPIGSSSDLLPLPMALSMRDLVSSGIAISAATAAQAVVSMKTSCHR